MTNTVTFKKMVEMEIPVATLAVDAGVRYFHDSDVNGERDNENEFPKIFGAYEDKSGDIRWRVDIDVVEGKIKGWPKGMIASLHYKVCDDGIYKLLDKDGDTIAKIEDDYVPKILSPGGEGYGDYIIMDIDEKGYIENWKVDFQAWEEEDVY